MIQQNSEALSKICPMAQTPDRTPRCVGRECMAWRPVDAKNGYCGMAGAPRELLYAIPADTVADLYKQINEASAMFSAAAFAPDADPDRFEHPAPVAPPAVDSRLGEE